MTAPGFDIALYDRQVTPEWPAAKIEMLRQLWAEGVPTAEIARCMKVSKNAVVGKAHRLGLDPRPTPIVRRDPNTPASAPKAKPVGKVTLPPAYHERGRTSLQADEVCALNAARSAVATQREMDAITAAERPALATVFRPIAGKSCQFPMWGQHQRPTHRYCGDAAGKSGYCSEHHRTCFVPARLMSMPAVSAR